MEKQFKILLVSISWSSPNRIQEITKSFRELKPSNSDGNRFEFDLVLYTKEADKYFQFCIQTSSIPFLKSTNNEWLQSNQLFNIQDDLWIIKGDWDFNYQGKGYHKCPTICKIRGKTDTHSDLKRSGIPEQSGHLFCFKADTHSG